MNPDLSNAEIGVEGEYAYCDACGLLFHWEQLTLATSGQYYCDGCHPDHDHRKEVDDEGGSLHDSQQDIAAGSSGGWIGVQVSLQLVTMSQVIAASSEPGWVRTVVIGAVWIALFVVAYLLLIRWLPSPSLSDMQTRANEKKHFKNETVRISDLVSSESGLAILDGFVFEDCTLVGPVLLHILPGPPSNLIVGPWGFSDPLDSSVVTVSTSNNLVAGVVGIRGVRMIRCQFKGVAFSAGPQRAADLKTALLRSMVEGKRTELKHGQPLTPGHQETSS